MNLHIDHTTAIWLVFGTLIVCGIALSTLIGIVLSNHFDRHDDER